MTLHESAKPHSPTDTVCKRHRDDLTRAAERQLSEKDLFVRVEGINDEGHQLADVLSAIEMSKG